jgi:putative transposase
VIRLVVMIYVRFALSPRNVGDLPFERGIDICRQRASRLRGFRHCWHLDEMFVKSAKAISQRPAISRGSYLDEEALNRHGAPEAVSTDGLRS